MSATRVQRRRPLSSVLTFPLFALAVLVVAIAIYTVINGELRIPFLSDQPIFAFGKREAQISPEDYVSVPLSVRPIAAYTQVGRDHYWNMETQEYSFVNLPRSSMTEDIVTMADIRQMRGRILARDKDAQMAFRWSDFLPKGTRAGLAGGVPVGTRGLWVETEKVQGLADLRAGDRFDILATTELKNGRNANPQLSGVYAAELQMQAAQRSRAPQARVDVVVQNGVLVVPMRTREKPITSSSLMRGQRRSSVPVQEVFVAVTPQELAPLTRAIALGLDLRVGLRSGRLDEPTASLTPSLQPTESDPLSDMFGASSSFAFVEVITGSGRERVLRRRAESETDAWQAVMEWWQNISSQWAEQR